MPRVAPSNKKERSGGNGWLKHDNTLKGAWSFRTKEKIQCLCEGGTRCSKEAPEAQKGGNAIPGLHSNWVGQDASMLAMARPWHQYVLQFRLVDAFVGHNIGMVLNLQEVGEHDHCGPGNLRKSGFSYDPELFMAAKIGFFNFSWQDMGVPDLDRMMDIVQVMDYTVAVEKRKVAVHCHAGLGRTGLAIACYFLYQNRTSGFCCSKQVIQTVRNGRPGALQTRTQELFVSIFQQYLLYLSCLFGGVEGPPRGLQSLHSNTNLAAMATPQQTSQSQQQNTQQQPQSQPRHSSSGFSGSAFSVMGLLGRRSSPPKPAALQALQKPQSERGSLDSTSTGSLFASSLPGSCNSLPSNADSIKEGTTGNTATKVFEHGLKIIGPSTPRTERKSEGGPRSVSPELASASRLQERQEHKPQKQLMPPWDDKRNIQLSKYSTSWVPQPPHTYAEALRRQQRLLHGSHRRSYNHLHRFLKKAVFAIIAAAQEARANAAQEQAGEISDALPLGNQEPLSHLHAHATAYVPQPLIYHHITQSQQHHHVQNHHQQHQYHHHQHQHQYHHNQQQQQQSQQQHWAQQQQQQPQHQQQSLQAQPRPKPQPLHIQSTPPIFMSSPNSPLRPLVNPPSLPNSPPPSHALTVPISKRGNCSNFNLTPIEWSPDMHQAGRESPMRQLQEQMAAQEVLRISPTMRPRKLPPQRSKCSSTHASCPLQSSSELLMSEELVASLPQHQPQDLVQDLPPSPQRLLGAQGVPPSPSHHHTQQPHSRPRLRSSPGQLQLPSQPPSQLPSQQLPSQICSPSAPLQAATPAEAAPPAMATPPTPHQPPTTVTHPPSSKVKASLPQPTQPTHPPQAAHATYPTQPTHPTQATQAPMPGASPASARAPLPTPPPGQAPPTALAKRRSSIANGPAYAGASIVTTTMEQHPPAPAPPSSQRRSSIAVAPPYNDASDARTTATHSSTLPPPLTTPPPSALAKRDNTQLSPHLPASPSAGTQRTSAWDAVNSSDAASPIPHTLRPPTDTQPPPTALTKRANPNPTVLSVQQQQQQQQQQQRSSGPVAEGVESLDLAGHHHQQHYSQQQQQQHQQQQQQQQVYSSGSRSESVEGGAFEQHARHHHHNQHQQQQLSDSRRGPVCEGLEHAEPAHMQGLGMYLRAPPQQQQQEQLQLCRSFTHALALCTQRRRLEQQGVNVVASLAHSPAYCYPFLGREYSGAGVELEHPSGAKGRSSVKWDEGEGLVAHMEHELVRLKRRANHEDFSLASKAPLLLLVQALHDFFQQFHDAGPSLSLTTMEHAMKHYKTLPYEADPTTPEAQQLQAASLTLSPIPVCDQELLLLFVALMRNCELAGGAGMSEEEEPELHTVTIGRWVLHLLVGPNMSAEVEEAMLSLLWYYLRNDIAYSALVLAKKKRLDKLVHGGRPLVDHPAKDPVLAKYHHASPPPPSRSNAPNSLAPTQHMHQPQHKGDASVQVSLHQPQYELPQGQPLSTLLETSRVHQSCEPALVSDQGIPWVGAMITDALADQPASLLSGPPLPEIHDVWK